MYMNEQTPRQRVKELGKYIVGQSEAKRSVAIALRNRWRSRQLSKEMSDDIIPKNILMIGSTGVGKTEIARRLAKFVEAPFIKVEATKFTEVGYVGRDVESIIRDLTEIGVRMVQKDRLAGVQEKAKKLADERILDVFVPEPAQSSNPLSRLFGSEENGEEKKQDDDENQPKYAAGREWCRKRLENGELEEKVIEIDVADNSKPVTGMFAGSGFEGMSDNIQDMIGSLVPKKHRKRKVTVSEARKIFTQEEAMKLIDMEDVQEKAVQLVEHTGIVFLDEIDKSLHSYLVEHLIAMFNDKEQNSNNSQLIFNTHDTNLLDLNILRRDQIWFTEKNANTGESTLYPLSDFSVRKQENIEKGYLLGRYGAVPFIKNDFNLVEHEEDK